MSPYGIAGRAGGGGEATLLDKSVFFWAKKEFNYAFGKCPTDKCAGYNDKGIFEANHDFGAGGKREVGWALISQLGDLLVSGSDAFISYSSGELGNDYCVKVPDGSDALYFGRVG